MRSLKNNPLGEEKESQASNSPSGALISGKKPWKKVTVRIYGRDVSILTKTMVGMWYTVSGLRPVRVVVTRDPSGRIKDRAFFSTNPSMSVENILVYFSKRWEIE